MEGHGRRFLKFVIWLIIAAPVVAGTADLTLWILSIGRTERGHVVQVICAAVFTWLKAPATLLFLNQLFCKAIRTMPAPPEHCTFGCRWIYDLAQSYGENPDLKGKTRPVEPTPPPPNKTEDLPA